MSSTPIATSVPGLQICEHLPRLARWMHKATLIRSVSHTYNSHNPYAVLTGFTGGDDRENYFTKRSDHPGISAVCQYLGIGPRDLPGSVYLPALPGYSQGLRRAGPIRRLLGPSVRPTVRRLRPEIPARIRPESVVLRSRHAVWRAAAALARVGTRTDHRPIPAAYLAARRGRSPTRRSRTLTRSRHDGSLSAQGDRALDLEPGTRRRLTCRQRPETTRRRYGKSLFGTSLLVARRLVEAGVTFVGVTTESRGAGHWDSHEKNFSMLKTFNLPNLDEIGSALTRRPEPARAARDDAGRHHGRDGPRSARQRQGRPRPLAPVRVRLALRRRSQRRLRPRCQRQAGSLPDRTARLTRRPGRHDVPPPRRRFPTDASRPDRPADRHCPRRGSDHGGLWLSS